MLGRKTRARISWSTKGRDTILLPSRSLSLPTICIFFEVGGAVVTNFQLERLWTTVTNFCVTKRRLQRFFFTAFSRENIQLKQERKPWTPTKKPKPEKGSFCDIRQRFLVDWSLTIRFDHFYRGKKYRERVFSPSPCHEQGCKTTSTECAAKEEERGWWKKNIDLDWRTVIHCQRFLR